MLTDPGLPDGPRTMVAFAWSAASVFPVFVALAFLWSAVFGTGIVRIAFTTAHCAVIAVLRTAMALRARISPLTFPPAPLFT
ncbi:hypothetical protein [Jannaschia faecimaris]|uniref:hypothetical protein n=1 Tax=Jannaschia faecimaris TaxID=1244108 RepID=UPI000B865203|nr:hypothetical protein [Jannaschia faecimaris]